MNALFKILLLLLFFEKEKKRDNFYYKPRRHIDKLWRFLFLFRVSSSTTHGWENTLSSSCSLSYSLGLFFYSPLLYYSSSFPQLPRQLPLWPGGTHNTRGSEWFPIRFRQRDTILFLFFFFFFIFPVVLLVPLFRLFCGVYRNWLGQEEMAAASSSFQVSEAY